MARSTQGFLKEVARKRSRGLRVGNQSVNRFLRAQLEEEASANVARGISNRNFNESTRRFDVQQNALEEQRKQAERAATIGGIKELGVLGLGAEQLANERGTTIFGKNGFLRGGDGTIQTTTKTTTPSSGVTQQVAGTATKAVTGGSGFLAASSPEASSILSATATGGAEAGAAAETAALAETGSGFGVSSLAVPAVAGFGAKTIAEKLGANQEIANTAGGFAAGGAIGLAGGPIGALVGGVIGFVAGEVADSVICTELHRQGYMEDELLVLDGIFGASVDREVYMGYRKMADPIVEVMKKSKSFTWLVSKVTRPWVLEMAHCVRPDEYKSNIVGKIIMKIGIPLCRHVGGLNMEVQNGLS